MRSIRRIASSVVAASLLTALVVEAAEAISDRRLPYEPVDVGDSGTIPEPVDPQPSTAEPLPAPEAVGRTAGVGGVSPAGEARYSIPLELPPGTHGLMPRLSLEYRHGMTGGAMGVGWAIGGTSVIARCPRTIAQDGAAGPVTNSRSDRFCLDGTRLVVVNGREYGSSGAEYRTELETFARIRSYGTAGSGPQYFIVEAADGRIYEYGMTADSRIDWSGSAYTPRAWALNRVRDRAGNAVDFVYAEDAATGSYRLARVHYNGNPSAGVAATTEVAFAWENRPPTDKDLGYVAGYRVLQVLRLRRVDVQHDGALVRRYELGYQAELPVTGRSRLVSVQECGRDAAQCLPPTTITWQDGAAGLGAERAVAMNLGEAAGYDESKLWWSGDVNGDGRDDLVWSVSTTSGVTLRYRLAQAGGGFGEEVDTGIAASGGAGVPMDYDGDGLSDVLTISATGRWLVVRGTAAGLGAAVDTGIAARPIDYRGADLNGDGLADLVYSESIGTSGNGLVVRVRYNTRGAGFAAIPVTLYEQGYHTGYEVAEGGNFLGRAGQRIDLDGDGREDLMMNEEHSIARISADRRMSEAFDSSFSGGTPADVNGDGCTDFAYPHYQGRWRVRFSPCLVEGPAGVEIAGPSYTSIVREPLAIDWNGDGREDLLYRDASTNWKVVQSAGDSLLPTIDSAIAHGSPTGVAVADLDGDGLPDLAARSRGALAYRLHAGAAPDLLRTVRDGFGAVTAFVHASSSDPAVYSKGPAASWPQREDARPRWLVATMTTGDGAAPGSQAVTSYSYAGARIDLTGRGDLGVARRVAKETVPAGLVVEESYRQDFPFVGLLERETVKAGSGAVVRDVANDWTSLALGSGSAARRYAYPARQSSTSYDAGSGAGALATTTATIDAIDPVSGLVTDGSLVITEGAGGSHPGAALTERIQHLAVLNDTTYWCLGRPQSTTVTASHSLPGGEAIERSGAITWDGPGCRPVRVQRAPGDSRWQVTVDFAYDGFGNIARRSVTGAGMAPRVDTLHWGAKGRFPERLTDALGQSTLLQWDGAIGRALVLTDPNGLQVKFEYDAFGRSSVAAMPDGRRRERALQSCGSGCAGPARARLEETEKAASGELLAARTSELDALGRVIRSVTRMIGGGQSQESAEFDARGRLVRQYLPAWLGGASGGSRRYSYDDRGRLLSEVLQGADGAAERSLTHSYFGLTHKVTDSLGRATSTTMTAWGDTAEVQDPLGARTRYEHDAFGHLLRVHDAGGTPLADLAYNPFGLKLTHVDADLGTWTLTRNALGEVISQRNAKGQLATYEYDLLGRLKRRTELEGVTTWSWGSSATSRNVGQLVSVTGPGYAESYSYDALSRLSRRTISSEGVHYYDYGYDAAGRLASLTYPASVAGFRLELGYEYEGAHPIRIRDRTAQGQVLWQLGAVDAAGNVLDESRGSRLRVFSGYNPATGMLDYRQALADAVPVQDVSFGWDGAGNLRERRDLGRNSLESFGYDTAGRLVTATRNGVHDLAIRYDFNGNIAWKSDVCPSSASCFTYDPAHRHAVAAAGSGRYAYDANGNMTSRSGSSLSWYSYDLPSVINQGTSQTRFWYGPARNRWKQVASGPAGTETTVYVGELLEKVTQGSKTSWRHYVQAPTGTAGVHVRHADGTAPRTYLMTQDHLGGTDTILDAATGSLVLREAFDPFGRRRASSGVGVPGAAELAAIGRVTRDGFTGHEHLDHVGLVHMNGRIYDPAIARFLSPDPVVTSPFNRQDLNRYSYAWNNPLSIVDPTGLEEVTCLHGPHGRCAGVTVTGLRDRPPGGPAYYAWRTGSNGQAVSAAQRDPCGQDGSAAACSRGQRDQSVAGDVAHHPTRGPGTTTDYWQGFAAQVGNLGMNSVPVFWLFGVGQDYTWFPIPDSQAGSQGANLGNLGYLAGGFAGAVRSAATRTLSSTGGVVRRFELPEDRVFYRTFSGDASVGAWLTSTRPRSQSWAQEALALPPWNKATHVQEVRVPRGTLVERSRASDMPEWGRTRGGAEQFKLLETIPENSFGPGSPLP